MSLSNSIERKFTSSFSLEDLEIETDEGWVDIDYVHKTIPYKKYKIVVESGLFIECADNHIVFDHFMNEVFVKDLVPFESAIQTKNGIEEVIYVQNLGIEEEMYDVSLASKEKRFYSNGILSHNSSIHTALTFCLFGKTTRGVNLNQLINSINEKDCLVEVEFDCFGNSYVVKRGLKPSRFEIEQNGTILKQDSRSKDFQKYLEEQILRTDFKTFTTVIVVGGRNYIPFMKLAKADRRKIIESLLHIDIFSLMNQTAKNKSQELLEQIKEKKIEIKELTSEISYIKELIQKTLLLIEKNKENNQEKISLFQQKIKDLDISLEEKNQELKNIEQKFGNIEVLERNFKEKENKLIYSKNRDIDKKNKLEQSKLFYKENNSCPTCSQVINDKMKEEKLLVLNEKIINTDKHISSLEESLNELSSFYKEVSKGLDYYKSIISLKERLLNEKNSYISIINELITSSSTLSLDIDIIKEEELIFIKNNLLNEKKDELINLIEETDYYEFCQFLLKDDGVKTLIIKEYLPKINNLLNIFLEELNLSIDFRFDENFNEIIKSRYRDNFSYESFSDGQKMKIDLALLFTWREISKMKNSLNANILFCDEITDSSLDPQSTELVIGLLERISLDTSIFVISHKSELFESKMDRILSLSLVNNFTSINEII